MYQRLLILTFLTFSRWISFGQAITFEKYYDTLGCYDGTSVEQTIDDGFIICGSAYDNGGAQNAFVLKTDSFGNLLWVKLFGSNGSQGAYDIHQLPDSSYILLAFFDGGLYSEKIWLIKLNQNGDSLWSRSFSLGIGGTIGAKLTICNDDGFAITGRFYDDSLGIYRAFIIKTDSTGNSIWTKLYGGVYNQSGFSIIQTNDTGFVIVGQQENPANPSEFKLLVLKTNSVGDTSLTRLFGNGNFNTGQAVKQSISGEIVVAGYSYNVDNYDFYLLKLNENGDTLWTRLLGDNVENSAYSFQITNDNNYIIGGLTAGNNGYDFYIIKTDSSGSILWTKKYGSGINEILFSLTNCKDGGIAATGYSDGSGQIFFIKTDGLGSLIDITEIYRNNYIKIYPNPITENAVIEINETINLNNAYMKVFDIYGRLVLESSINSKTINFKCNDLPAGCYILNVISNDKNISSIKFVVQ